MGGGLESLTKVKIKSTDCSPLIHEASHLIIEGNQFGQS